MASERLVDETYHIEVIIRDFWPRPRYQNLVGPRSGECYCTVRLFLQLQTASSGHSILSRLPEKNQLLRDWYCYLKIRHELGIGKPNTKPPQEVVMEVVMVPRKTEVSCCTGSLRRNVWYTLLCQAVIDIEAVRRQMNNSYNRMGPVLRLRMT